MWGSRERMEAAIDFIRSELEQIIQQRMEVFLSYVDHKTHSFHKELTKRILMI
jgi:hypothetical protein